MYQTIMVPLDGSAFSEHALPMAAEIAGRAGATLHLVHVHSPLSAVYLEGAGYFDKSLEAHFKQERESYLGRVVNRLWTRTSVPVTSALLEGGVAATLAEHAASKGVDLVVMTTHGRGALGRFWLGSVADELVRRLPMPLLLMRPGKDEPGPATAPAIKHVLLPLDGTAFAEEMIEPAAALAVLMGAEVTLLRVVRPTLPVLYPAGVTVGMGDAAQAIVEKVERIQSDLQKEAALYLHDVAGRLRGKGLTVHTRVVVGGQPAVAILEEAKSKGGDLIAVETHARHGLPRLFLGSVADKVVRGATVPVLVHRPLS